MNFKNFTAHYALPLWKWYVGGALSLALSNLIMLKVPQLAKQVINRIADDVNNGSLSHYALLIIVLGVGQIFVRAVSRLLLFWPGRHIESEAKIDTFDQLIRIFQNDLEKWGIGDLVSRLANDITHLRIFYAFSVLQILNLLFLTSFSVVQMLSTSGALTFCALFPLVLMLVITKHAMPKLQRYGRENQEAIGRLTNRISEGLVNIHTLQANDLSSAILKRANSESATVYATHMKAVMIRTIVFPLMTLLSGFAQFGVLLVGGYLTLQSKVTVGDILAFNVYIGLLTFPLMAVGIVLSSYQRAKVSLERLREIECAPKEFAVSPAAPIFTNVQNDSLEVRNLSFAYSKGGSDVLNNVSFSLRAGVKLGIFGAIGSGKTTLFRILTRIYDPPEGTVFLDGQDLRNIPLGIVRDRIGYVEQAAQMFSDSVRNNICLGIEDVTREMIECAARMAGVYDDIMALPNSWDTQVGENGVKLSGGQKQRIALARVLIRPHSVVILDDVLSAVDHGTEEQLVAMIRSLRATCLIASHRLSVLSVCDQVLVLNNGCVRALGSFKEVSAFLSAEKDALR